MQARIEGSGKKRGLVLAAPSTGSGKTMLALALIHLLKRRGFNISPLKVGPDYIDSAFLEFAAGRPCRNVDGWAMRGGTIAYLLRKSAEAADFLLIESAMGLFDGASLPGLGENLPSRLPPGSGAEIAALTGFPVLLVLSAKGFGHTAAALLHGLASFDPTIYIAGVIFNNVASNRHKAILEAAAKAAKVTALGFIESHESLGLPSRHLGLVQAGEIEDLAHRLPLIAGRVAEAIDLDRLIEIFFAGEEKELPSIPADFSPPPLMAPLGQRIAVAKDRAFAFSYPAILEEWRARGAEIRFFSPLQNEGPGIDSDAIFLPGGYPELYAGALAGNRTFLSRLRDAARRGAVIYGECGGYMVLGRVLIDKEGQGHIMADLLPLETSFKERRLHLGYREGVLLESGPLGQQGVKYRGHEFHYATIVREEGDHGLFRVMDAGCREMGIQGRRQGSVMGSFFHLIDVA